MISYAMIELASATASAPFIEGRAWVWVTCQVSYRIEPTKCDLRLWQDRFGDLTWDEYKQLALPLDPPLPREEFGNWLLADSYASIVPVRTPYVPMQAFYDYDLLSMDHVARSDHPYAELTSVSENDPEWSDYDTWRGLCWTKRLVEGESPGSAGEGSSSSGSQEEGL